MKAHVLRLAFPVAGMAIVLGLVLLADRIGWWEALIVGVVGAATGIAVTIEAPAKPAPAPEQPDRRGKTPIEMIE